MSEDGVSEDGGLVVPDDFTETILVVNNQKNGVVLVETGELRSWHCSVCQSYAQNLKLGKRRG